LLAGTAWFGSADLAVTRLFFNEMILAELDDRRRALRYRMPSAVRDFHAEGIH
jgi:hypothetical protein